MTTTNVSEHINELANQWHHFKEQNNQRLSTLEQKNYEDPITLEQLQKLNKHIDHLQDSMKNLEINTARPQINGEAKFNSQDSEHKKAFNDYIRKGLDNNLPNLETKALSTSNDSDGGYFVTRQIEHNVIERLYESSNMRKLASIQKISSDALEILEDYNHAECGWSNDGAAVKETASPRINKKIIPVHELYAQPKATQKLIDDAAINIEQWLEDKIASSFGSLEEASFIKGDGLAKPKGILSYQDGKEWGKIEQIKTGTANGAMTFSSLVKFVYSLPDIYRNKASVLMNRQTISTLRTLKNEQTGEYIWSPGLFQGGKDTLFGLPIHHSDYMPAANNGELAMAIADFKEAYLIVDRTNIKLMRDPFTEKPFVKFYITKRVGGDVKNFDAIKLLKLSN